MSIHEDKCPQIVEKVCYRHLIFNLKERKLLLELFWFHENYLPLIGVMSIKVFFLKDRDQL